MFLLVSVRHVGAHPDELQQGVSIQSSINLGKTFPRISRIRIIPSTQILARVFVYLSPFVSQILDFICRMVLIFILIYFVWRDTENQQYIIILTWLRGFREKIAIFSVHCLIIPRRDLNTKKTKWNIGKWQESPAVVSVLIYMYRTWHITSTVDDHSSLLR